MNERKNLYIVTDEFGNPWGPFEAGMAAATWAREKWPDKPYQVVALRAPDE